MESRIIGIMVGDTEHVIEANDAYLRLLGYIREDLLADRLRWRTLVAPEHLATMEHAVQEALTRGHSALTDCEYVRHDGSRVQTMVGLVRLERDLMCYVGFVLDVTERKRLEREREEARANQLALREADRRKDEFLGDISHELRTPLTSPVAATTGSASTPGTKVDSVKTLQQCTKARLLSRIREQC
jgi:PAS domain S-box-containing protein